MVIFAANLYAEETWKIASLNWQPYAGSELPNQGYAIEKLRQLLKKEGIRVVVEFYPWRRARNIAKNKEYVGYFPAWPEEVQPGFIASPPVDWSEVGVMKQVGSSVHFDSIDELFEKYYVGVVQTYDYPQLINNSMQKYLNHVDNAPNEISLLKKLSRGRHSTAITDPKVMMYLAKQEDISNIEVMQVIMKKELVLAFRDDEENKSRIEILKKSLENM